MGICNEVVLELIFVLVILILVFVLVDFGFDIEELIAAFTSALSAMALSMSQLPVTMSQKTARLCVCCTN